MASGPASLLVMSFAAAAQDEISTNSWTVVRMVIATAVVLQAVAATAEAMAVHEPVEAALHGQESYPLKCFEPLHCLHSRSSFHWTRPREERQSCLHFSRPSELVLMCT